MIRRVQGHSMLPTLLPGAYVVGLRWFMRVRVGRVVVLDKDGREIIKRVSEISPEGVYVLGDHPVASSDSRQFGALPIQSVQSIVVWPRVKRRF